MDIIYKRISPQKAREMPQFLLSYLLADPDFYRFHYYVAITDKSIVGMLCENAAITLPEILSIAVSSEYTNNGIASGLLGYALKEMLLRVPDSERDIENSISARLVAPHGKLEILRHLFEKYDFTPYNEGSYYHVPVTMLKQNTVLLGENAIKKVKELFAQGRIVKVGDVSRRQLNTFGSKLSKLGFASVININDLDDRLSFFGVSNGEIDSCILFEKTTEGIIHNRLLFHDGYGMVSPMTGYLLSAAAIGAYKNLDPDCELAFWIGMEATQKIIEKLLPHAEAATDVVEMELNF